MSRYLKNIAVLERLNCNIGEDGLVSYNEAILCAEIDTLAAEVRRLREANKSLKRLAAAVKCSEFDGMRCEDVDGMNWYDRRDELSDG